MSIKNIKLSTVIALLIHATINIYCQPLVVSLEKRKLNINVNDFFISDVIDVRVDTAKIGLVLNRHGAYASKIPVILDRKVSVAVRELLNTGFAQEKGNTPLIVKINRFWITDFGGENGLYRVFEVNLDFYVNNNGLYLHVFNAANFTKSKNSAESQKLDIMIAETIEKSTKELLFRMENNFAFNKDVSFEMLSENTQNDESHYKIHRDLSKDCIYYSFSNFRDGLADCKSDFKLKYFNRKTSSNFRKFKSVKNLSGREIPNEIYAISFDRKLYLKVNKVFVQVEQTHDGYFLEQMPKNSKRSRVLRGYGVGSTIGIIATTPFYGIGYVPIITGGIGAAIAASGAAHKPTGYSNSIDITSGLHIIKTDQYPLPSKTDLIMVFYIKRNNDQKIDLHINSNHVCSFSPNSYYQHFVVDMNEDFQVCIKFDNGEYCEIISQETYGKIYYEVIQTKEGGFELFQKKSKSNIRAIDRMIKKRRLTIAE